MKTKINIQGAGFNVVLKTPRQIRISEKERRNFNRMRKFFRSLMKNSQNSKERDIYEAHKILLDEMDVLKAEIDNVVIGENQIELQIFFEKHEHARSFLKESVIKDSFAIVKGVSYKVYLPLTERIFLKETERKSPNDMRMHFLRLEKISKKNIERFYYKSYKSVFYFMDRKRGKIVKTRISPRQIEVKVFFENAKDGKEFLEDIQEINAVEQKNI